MVSRSWDILASGYSGALTFDRWSPPRKLNKASLSAGVSDLVWNLEGLWRLLRVEHCLRGYESCRRVNLT